MLGMSLTAGVEMSDADRAELKRWLRSPSLRARLARRALIVLLAAEGVGTHEIAGRVGVSKQTVIG
jgi:DNA-binding NarL/FixJ family response regulator